MKIDLKLTKPKSRTIIHFITDTSDPWFININFENKKGEISRTSLVTQGRYKDWLDSYLRNGWIQEK